MAFSQVVTTTASVGAGASLDFTLNPGVSKIDILKIKVVPSVVGATSQLVIWKEAAKTNVAYKTSNFSGSLIDPIEDNAGVYTERHTGFVTVYEDLGAGGLIRCTVTNNDTGAKTYAVTIDYRPQDIWVVDDFSASLNGATSIFTLTATPDTTTLGVYADGVRLVLNNANGYTWNAGLNQITLTGVSANLPATSALVANYKAA